MNIWQIIIHENGNLEQYIYIDKDSLDSQYMVRLSVYNKLGYDMFNRPEVNVKFIKHTSEINVTCSMLKEIADGVTLVKWK